MLDALTPEIYIYYSGTEEPFPPGYHNQHLSDAYIMEFCYRGCGVLTLNGVSHRVETGDMFFTFPDCLVDFRADDADPWAKSWVCFGGAAVASYLSALGITPEHPIVRCAGHPEIAEYLDASRPVICDTSENAQVTRLRQSECAMRILSLIAALGDRSADSPAPASPQARYVERAIRYIDSAVSAGDRGVTVNGIAAMLGLNRAYFSTVFSRHTGKSPQQYLVDRKMQQACALFANPLSSASNVASTLGYEPAPFCRVFKKAVGMTPMEYKEYLKRSK